MFLLYSYIDGKDNGPKVKQTPEPGAPISVAPIKTKPADIAPSVENKAIKNNVNSSAPKSTNHKNIMPSQQDSVPDSLKEGKWIKGNINRKGQKIYHKPNQKFYKSTIPEKWFRTEDEAIKAGYRNAKDFYIKGNISRRSGEKIYHVPGQKYYENTIAEEWFRTEEEAESAGYRKSKI